MKTIKKFTYLVTYTDEYKYEIEAANQDEAFEKLLQCNRHEVINGVEDMGVRGFGPDTEYKGCEELVEDEDDDS